MSASEPSPTSSYRPHIDGLRAVAVYLVVAFHAGLSGFRGGFIGVDVFFVLSGFLVTGILLRDLNSTGRVDYRGFYARRFRRILPAAAAALLVTAAAYAIVATPLQTFDSIGGFRSSFLYVANWHFIREATDYFAPSVTASPVLHFWSLAVEEQFYFVWPLLFSGLFLACRRTGRASWWVLRALVLTIAIASLFRAISLGIGAGSVNFNRAYYGTDTRAYQLLAGALLALTPQLFRFARRFVRTTTVVSFIALAGLLLIGGSVVSVPTISRGTYAAALTFVIIVALEASPRSYVRRALADKRLAYLGRISFATYLWHWPIIVIVLHDYEPNPVFLFAIATVGATALAALSYHFIEQPVRIRPTLDRYRVQVIFGGLAISLVAGLLIAPAILLSQTDRFTNAAELSVSEPSITTGNVRLLDWRRARNDIPSLPQCFGKPVAECVVVHGSGERVLLVGDSIARMWLPAFTEIAKQEGLTLAIAALPSCPWQRELETTRMAKTCPGHRDDWYERVIPRFDPDIIVLAERPFDKPRDPFYIRGIERSVLAKSRAGERVLARFSRESLHAMRAPGRKIVILGPTPLPSVAAFDPESCLAAGGVGCAFRVDPKPTGLERYYRAMARRDPSVWALDLDRLACPRLPECDPVVNDIIVRRDHTHLTGTYALALSGSINALLHDKGILPERPHRS